MCVIAFSPKGADIPTDKQLKQMWEHNPDGAGFAYTTSRGVVYRKGFMTLDPLLEELHKLKPKLKNTLFAVHFRIGTSGKNDERTCHPFPLSTNYSDLIKTEGEPSAVLFHNGVLADGGLTNQLSSDTQDFTVAMTPLLRKPNKSKARDYFIEQLIVGNRLLVLYRGGKYKMWGKWEKMGDLYFSNLYWQTFDWEKEYYYSYYHPTTTPVKWTTEDEWLWEDVLDKQYKWISPEELKQLKRSADDYTDTTITKGDAVLEYDEGELLVWLSYNGAKEEL